MRILHSDGHMDCTVNKYGEIQVFEYLFILDPPHADKVQVTINLVH